MRRKRVLSVATMVIAAVVATVVWIWFDGGDAPVKICGDVAQAPIVPQQLMTRFSVGPVGFAAEPPRSHYDSENARWIYVFKLPMYFTEVDAQSLTIEGTNIETGSQMQFDGANGRQPGPLILQLSQVPRDFYPMAAYIAELGLYRMTVSGDGKNLGARRIAFCTSVTVL